MKKALVFRTAQMFVVDNLMEKLERKGYDIYCIVQKSSLDIMKNKYPNISFFVVDDGFFDYKTFKLNKELTKKIKKVKFSRVFVTSSSYRFTNFLEVRRIIYSLGFRKITYFVAHGKVITMDLNPVELYAEMIIKSKHFLNFIIALGYCSSAVCFLKNRIFKIGGH